MTRVLKILADLRVLRGPLGWRAASEMTIRRLLRLRRPMKVRIGQDVVRLRPTNSDAAVAAQIFGQSEYGLSETVTAALRRLAAAWRAKGAAPVIVDGGANVGYSAIHFARTFPEATVLAIEPDPETFAELTANCGPIGSIRCINAALWSHEAGVSLDSPANESWAAQVSDGGRTPSRTLDSLFAEIPEARPLIIKLDIEGAESEVLKASLPLIAASACLMVEPHDWMSPGNASIAALYKAVAGRTVDTLLQGENLIIFDSVLTLTRVLSST